MGSPTVEEICPDLVGPSVPAVSIRDIADLKKGNAELVALVQEVTALVARVARNNCPSR